MKRRQISAWVIGMSLASTVLAEEAEPFEPDFSQLTKIEVRFRGWRGVFSHSGSAVLLRHEGLHRLSGEEKTVRSSATLQRLGRVAPDLSWDSANAPEGSFSLEDIYRLVAPQLRSGSTQRPAERLSISFSFGYSYNPTIGFYITDKAVMKTLMHGLRDKVVPWSDDARAYLEELLSTYPLVPGEQPAPFAYGWDDEAFRIASGRAYGPNSEETQNWFLHALQKRTPEEKLASAAECARWEAFFERVKENPADNTVPVKGGSAETQPTPTETAVTVGGGSAETPPPTLRRPWLYVGTLAILCAVGIAFWFSRRKR